MARNVLKEFKEKEWTRERKRGGERGGERGREKVRGGEGEGEWVLLCEWCVFYK